VGEWKFVTVPVVLTLHFRNPPRRHAAEVDGRRLAGNF
jgi:hypothetical protein